MSDVEHERDIEREEIAEPGRIEPPRRVREADVAHRTGSIRPPGVDGAIGEPEVGGQVAEEVESQRRRPEEAGLNVRQRLVQVVPTTCTRARLRYSGSHPSR